MIYDLSKVQEALAHLTRCSMFELKLKKKTKKTSNLCRQC